MENKEFKPYVPADKVTPEFTATSIIIGVLLAIIFGAANAYLGLRVGMTVSASIPAAGYFDGSNPSNYEKRFDSGEQHGADNRFCR